MTKSVTILGVNGRVGRANAAAFLDAGWDVTGFGRENRTDFANMKFVIGTTEDAAAMHRAVDGADVVVNALNLPYDTWDKGRAEAQLAGVLDVLKGSGKTLMFPANIYNFAAETHVLKPDTPRNPARDKGHIRQRMEDMLEAVSQRGDVQVIMLRCPDFYGPGYKETNFDLAIMPQAAKGTLMYPGDLSLGHSWAYLPDLGRAFEKLASQRTELGAFENFHFAGHFATGKELMGVVQAAIPFETKVKPTPWFLLKVIGLFVPILREVIKMRYLWNEPHRLVDPRLDAILGEDFATPFVEAVTKTVRSYLPKETGAKVAIGQAKQPA